MSILFARDGSVMPLPQWLAARTDPATTTLASTPLPDGSRLVTVWAGVDLGFSTASGPGDAVVLFLTCRMRDRYLPQPLATWETEEQARQGHDALIAFAQGLCATGQAVVWPQAAEASKRDGAGAPDSLAEQERAALARLDEIRAMRGRG